MDSSSHNLTWSAELVVSALWLEEDVVDPEEDNACQEGDPNWDRAWELSYRPGTDRVLKWSPGLSRERLGFSM